MRLWATVALAAAACGVDPAASSARTFTPEPKAIDVIKVLTADDARAGIFASHKSLFDYRNWTGPYLKTIPQAIAADYDRNEISADDKYKDILTVFSGQISTIS
jgi:hypothetical protein